MARIGASWVYGAHRGTVPALGLELACTRVSSQDDWDRYEGPKWYAAEQWASAHLEDPDVLDALEHVRRNQAVHLMWERETLGWAIYVFKKGAYGG